MSRIMCLFIVVVILSIAGASLVSAADNDYSTVHYPHIVDLSQGEQPAQTSAELDFLQTKLANIKSYIDSLQVKLQAAEKAQDHDRIAQLSNLLTKAYNRITRVNQELAALQPPVAATLAGSVQLESRQAAVAETENVPKDIFSDIGTDADICFDTNAEENKQISQAQISANLAINKGPFYIKYSHNRIYTRQADEYFGDVSKEFQGEVNNQIVIGVSFTPGFDQQPVVAGTHEMSPPVMQASSVVN